MRGRSGPGAAAASPGGPGVLPRPAPPQGQPSPKFLGLQLKIAEAPLGAVRGERPVSHGRSPCGAIPHGLFN